MSRGQRASPVSLGGAVFPPKSLAFPMSSIVPGTPFSSPSECRFPVVSAIGRAFCGDLNGARPGPVVLNEIPWRPMDAVEMLAKFPAPRIVETPRLTSV